MISTWIWTITTFFYLGGTVASHWLRSIPPYSGLYRWISILEIVLLTLLEWIEAIPLTAGIGLRYLQIAFVSSSLISDINRQESGVISDRQNPRRHTFLFFRSAYFVTMYASCFISLAVQSNAFPVDEFILIIFTLFILYRFIRYCVSQTKDDQSSEPQEILKKRLLSLYHGNELTRNHQRALFKTALLFCKWQQCTPVLPWIQRSDATRGQASRREDPLTISTQRLQSYATFEDALQEQIRLIAFIETIFAKKTIRKEENATQTVSWNSFLQKYFQQIITIREWTKLDVKPDFAPESGLDHDKIENDADAKKIQLQILADSVVQSEIPFIPVWTWVITRWFDYFLNVQDAKKNIMVSISQAGQTIDLKGIGSWEIHEITSSGESIACPLCQTKVAKLYQQTRSTLGSCQECLKIRLEQQLKKDWDFSEESTPEVGNMLWFAKESVFRLHLGSISYGIENWQRWEYSITLGIGDFR